jgi:hypothetical protein
MTINNKEKSILNKNRKYHNSLYGKRMINNNNQNNLQITGMKNVGAHK